MLLSEVTQIPARGFRAVRSAVRAFRRDEDGALIIFTLYILICMLLAIGMALDTVRAEFARIRLQNTTDSAVLMAADLEQALTPTAVVLDQMERAGVDASLVNIEVTQGIDEKVVSAQTQLNIPTMFMDMVGITSLSAPASGTATESVTDLEIALALDNSGSMGQNNNRRLNLLKPAAKSFVDTVIGDDDGTGTVSVSIVPFATQVTVGADLLALYTGVSTEHSSSHCVTFEDSDFNSVNLPTTTTLKRTAHFDPNNKSVPTKDKNLVCSVLDSRKIAPWSKDKVALNAQIEAMEGRGWTSIELATKWGTALLDPSSRSVLTSMADKGLVNEKFRGQPFDYTRPNTQKYLVIMSDGANTNQWDIKDPYRSGQSPVFAYKDSSNTWRFSYYKADRNATNKFFWDSSDTWKDEPQGGDSASQLSWPDVWKAMGVKKFTEDLASPAEGGSANDHYNKIVDKIASGNKNTRTSNICAAAKAKGVVVFTIGMDTYGQGDATLSDCASSTTHFYDVDSVDISTAFESIARTINQLRLTN